MSSLELLSFHLTNITNSNIYWEAIVFPSHMSIWLFGCFRYTQSPVRLCTQLNWPMHHISLVFSSESTFFLVNYHSLLLDSVTCNNIKKYIMMYVKNKMVKVYLKTEYKILVCIAEIIVLILVYHNWWLEPQMSPHDQIFLIYIICFKS